VIGIGGAVGLFNGFMIVKLRFNAFIFTLAMLILLAGLQQGIVSGRTSTRCPVVHLPRLGLLGRLPCLGVGDSAAFLVAGLFLRYHRPVARSTRSAATSRPRARRDQGRPHPDRGLTVAACSPPVAGLMIAGQVVAVTANQGNNLIFHRPSPAAVIGGIELEGGRGRMIGAFTASCCSGSSNNVLVLRNTSTFWIDAAERAIILIALGLAAVIGMGGRRGSAGEDLADGPGRTLDNGCTSSPSPALHCPGAAASSRWRNPNSASRGHRYAGVRMS